MKQYKYLVMQITYCGHATFLAKDLGGSGRSHNLKENQTFFKPYNASQGHDNDDYWNTPEELLIGYCRWHNRVVEKEAHHMTNRLYAATNTYRFFRVEDALWDEDEMTAANNNLYDYQITEEQFIEDMQNSWAFKQVQNVFEMDGYLVKDEVISRPEQAPVEVGVVHNTEFDTWTWSSDYLNGKGMEPYEVKWVTIPVGMNPEEAEAYITNEVMGCCHRFGGNDTYNKRKELEGKV